MPQKKGKKRKPSGSDEDQEVIFNLPPNAKKMKVSPPDTPPPPPNKNEPAPEAGHGPRRSPNGYILPDQLPEGMVVTDLLEQKWRLGKSIGVGGFGEIYSAALLNGKNNDSLQHKVLATYIMKRSTLNWLKMVIRQEI